MSLGSGAAAWMAALACLAIPAVAGAAPACPAPAIRGGADGMARTTLDVLTYNIEGLGFPARLKRGSKLARIGAQLAELRRQGRAPDVILFQEVFSGDAKAAVEAAGYPHVVYGPGRKARRDLPADREARKGAGKRSFRRGEIGLKLAGGGLAIASRYPIEAQAEQPFAARSCAGFDCFANKGAVFARVRVPGAPEAVDLFGTHLNSRKASRAPARRTLPIYRAQASELGAFIDLVHTADYPAILGGDFNMRNSEVRFDFLESRLPLTLTQRHCLNPEAGCEVKISSDGDEPWMDTQDLQFFRSGRRVTLRPVRLEAMFDGSPDSPALSDHDGYRVVYELSWPAAETIPAACR
ncbi:MAG: metal-dependent hydrolase [Phenylobacterium zucineum]|nr:MAG: metal-dependent hydrolase [Phenylobacterium zucineum]